MARLPEWDRPKLTETQLNGEEKRLAPRGLFPEQVRADLIRALASMDGATTVAAACRILGDCIEVSPSLVENCLSGRMPLYDSILVGLYGAVPSGTLLPEWASPADFGPLLPHAIAAGLITATDTPEPTTSPDPGAAGVHPTVTPPAPEIAALAPTPLASGDTEPAGPETICSAPELGPVAGVETGASPVLSSVSLRAPDAADQAEAPLREGDHRLIEPVQLREVPAAAGQPLPAPNLPPLMFTAAPERLRDPVDPALDLLLQLAQDSERDAEAAREALAGLQHRLAAAEQRAQAAAAAFRLLFNARNCPADAGERAAA